MRNDYLNIDPPFFFKMKNSFQKFFKVPYSVNTKFSVVISIDYLNHFLLFINCKPYPNSITLGYNYNIYRPKIYYISII